MLDLKDDGKCRQSHAGKRVALDVYVMVFARRIRVGTGA